ncbi:MAG TPA: HD domain-containing protein [Lacunisphaera sp.]|jgi:uncharacterized protein
METFDWRFPKPSLTGGRVVHLLPLMGMDFSDWEQRCFEVLSTQGGDVAHDLGHVSRVVKNARRLAGTERARLDVVLPAAWLHDCVVVPKDSPRRKEASQEAATQAVHWLRDWGYAKELLPDIAHAIEAHSFSAAIQPRTIEAKVVQDADRLEAIGAVGLARCLMLSGAMGRPLFVENDPFCENRVADDHISAVDHFFTKLIKIEMRMQTESGRTEARQRTKFLQSFLDELRREIEPNFKDAV